MSQSGQNAFTAALAQIDADYCTGFVLVCGFTTPKCVVTTAACTAGTCPAVAN